MNDTPIASLLLLLFSTTHVARSGNSSGDELPAPVIYRQCNRRGDGSVCGMLEGCGGAWVAYTYSLHFSDQFSCIKFFDQSYGLKDINFQSLINYKSFLEFLLLFKSQHYPQHYPEQY